MLTEELVALTKEFEEKNSKYIVFEGTDGCGKSTIANAIYEALPGEKILTKEPGSPHLEFTQKIRELVLHGAAKGIKPITYAYLFAADTYEHMREIVIPSLKEDKWVISDRSVMSDFAYRPHHGDHIRQFNFNLFQGLNPKVFLIDALPSTCEERLENRGEPLNEFEKVHVIKKIRLIREAYLEHSMPRLRASNYCRAYKVDNNHILQDAIDAVKSVLALHFEELRGLDGFKMAADDYFN